VSQRKDVRSRAPGVKEEEAEAAAPGEPTHEEAVLKFYEENNV